MLVLTMLGFLACSSGAQVKPGRMRYGIADPHGKGVLVIEGIRKEELPAINKLVASYRNQTDLEVLQNNLQSQIGEAHPVRILSAEEFNALQVVLPKRELRASALQSWELSQ